MSTRFKLVAVGLIGLMAPLWWTWAVSQITYGLYLASGAPERPSASLLWGTIYIPQMLLGLITGVAIALISTQPFRAWATFLGSLVLGTLAVGLLFGSGIDYAVATAAATGNWFFVLGSGVWPAYLWSRRRAG